MRYFIVTYLQKPNGKYNETVNLDSHVRNRTLSTAAVILDYKERKVVKSRFDDTDFAALHSFFRQHYPDIINGLESKFAALEDIKMELMATVSNNA